MAKRTNPQNVIESYKRRQQMTPYVIGGLAALLVIVGVVILVFALRAAGVAAPAPTDTPTIPPATTSTPLPPTETQVPPTATKIPATATGTATPTVTSTPTGPFEYTVLEKDNCWDIAVKFKVDLNTLLAINSFPAGQCPITPGQKIMIPAPGQTLPTATPVDITKLASGTLLEYVVQPGDTLRAIALAYNSTQQRILDQNKMTDPNKLVAGQKLVIPVNIATQVPTTTDTPTPKPGTPSVTVAATKPAASATTTVTPTKAP
jgi:LysM repeat protein